MTATPPEDRKTPFRAGAEAGVAVPKVAAASFTGPVVLLADISEFQADITDTAYLAWSKAIVIRCAYGDAHDDGAWFGGERRALLHSGGARFVGIYQYLVAGQPGVDQAQAFRRIVGNIQPGEVFIADYEEGARARLTEWYNTMHSLYGPGITPYLWTYSGLNFGAANGVLPVEWIAAYGQGEPSSPHKLWQFTDAYKVPGVGTCDCSVWHGTIDGLAALAYPQPVVMRTVPNVVGMTQQDAAGVLWAAGLHPHGLPLAHVTAQNPKAGTKVPDGTIVNITTT